MNEVSLSHKLATYDTETVSYHTLSDLHFRKYVIKCLYRFSVMKIRRGWLGEAKVSCILRHRSIQLILAYSWTRPAILAAGKGRGGGMFLFLLFLHCYSFSFFPYLFLLLYYLFYLSSPFLWETTQNDPRVDVSLNPNSINRSMKIRQCVMNKSNCFCAIAIFCHKDHYYRWDRQLRCHCNMKLFLSISLLSSALRC